MIFPNQRKSEVEFSISGFISVFGKNEMKINCRRRQLFRQLGAIYLCHKLIVYEAIDLILHEELVDCLEHRLELGVSLPGQKAMRKHSTPKTVIVEHLAVEERGREEAASSEELFEIFAQDVLVVNLWVVDAKGSVEPLYRFHEAAGKRLASIPHERKIRETTPRSP